MADKIRWSISVTPVVEMTDSDAATHNAMHSGVGKSLGASGESTVSSAFIYDLTRTVSGSTYTHLNAGSSPVETLYIKHTGKKADGSAVNDVIYLSLDGSSGSGIQIRSEEACLLQLGITEDDIKVKTDAGKEVVIEFIMDAP